MGREEEAPKEDTGARGESKRVGSGAALGERCGPDTRFHLEFFRGTGQFHRMELVGGTGQFQAHNTQLANAIHHLSFNPSNAIARALFRVYFFVCFCGSSRDVDLWLEEMGFHQRAANVPYFPVKLFSRPFELGFLAGFLCFFGDGGASYAMIVGRFVANFTRSFAYAMMGLMAGDLEKNAEKKTKQAAVADEAERWELWLQITTAVAEIHEAGVFYFDPKPHYFGYFELEN